MDADSSGKLPFKGPTPQLPPGYVTRRRRCVGAVSSSRRQPAAAMQMQAADGSSARWNARHGAAGESLRIDSLVRGWYGMARGKGTE